jgi:hypothetical protein
MRVFAVSPFQIASWKEILHFLATLPSSLIVLPGYSANTPSPRQIQRVIHRKSLVFAEGAPGKNGCSAFIITHQSLKRMPSQVFSQSPKAADMDALAAILPQRTIRVGKREVTFLICGELMALNPDGSTKHRRELQYDIIVNPAHTTMGHWNHLGKKLARLSRRSIAVYVTNNDHNRHITSDVRIYNEGVLMERHSDINIAWSECVI